VTSSPGSPSPSTDTISLTLTSYKRPRVAHGRLDFLPVSNDACIQQQLLNAFLGISRHFVGIELAESASIAFTLVQDDRPTQSGLRRFQNKELERPLEDRSAAADEDPSECQDRRNQSSAND